MSGNSENLFPNLWGGGGEDIATVGAEPAADGGSVSADSYVPPVDIDSEGGAQPVDIDSETQSGQVAGSAGQPEAQGEVEYLDLTDETGRKRIKIDWANKDAIKKAISMAAGARKWQNERDQLRKNLEEREAQYKDVQTAWDAVEQAYTSQGLEGLVDLLANKQGAYTEWLQKQVDKELAKRDATPDELEKIQLRERLDRIERERSIESKRLKEREEAIAKERAAAEEAALQSVVNPSFDRVRFAGTLGNEQLEDRLDRTVWSEAIDILSNIEEQQGKQAITPAMTRRVFEEVASSLRQGMNIKAKEEAAVAAEARKANVATKVAAKAQTVQGSRQTDKESFNKHIADNNWAAALSSMLTGRVK